MKKTFIECMLVCMRLGILLLAGYLLCATNIVPIIVIKYISLFDFIENEVIKYTVAGIISLVIYTAFMAVFILLENKEDKINNK